MTVFYGGSASKKAKMNEICVVSVKQAIVKSKMKVEAGQVHKALILETKKGIQRKDGSYIKCFRNAAILLNTKNLPIATRITALSTYELRRIYGIKFLSLSGGSI